MLAAAEKRTERIRAAHPSTDRALVPTSAADLMPNARAAKAAATADPTASAVPHPKARMAMREAIASDAAVGFSNLSSASKAAVFSKPRYPTVTPAPSDIVHRPPHVTRKLVGISFFTTVSSFSSAISCCAHFGNGCGASPVDVDPDILVFVRSRGGRGSQMLSGA